MKSNRYFRPRSLARVLFLPSLVILVLVALAALAGIISSWMLPEPTALPIPQVTLAPAQTPGLEGTPAYPVPIIPNSQQTTGIIFATIILVVTIIGGVLWFERTLE